MHDSEPGLVLLPTAALVLLTAFRCRLQSLQIYGLEALDLQLINLRELAHLTASTSMRVSLPTLIAAEVVSKHTRRHKPLIVSIESFVSWGPAMGTVVASTTRLLMGVAHEGSAVLLVDVRGKVILSATHVRLVVTGSSTAVFVET